MRRPGWCAGPFLILKLRISNWAKLEGYGNEILICFGSSELLGFPRVWGLDRNWRAWWPAAENHATFEGSTCNNLHIRTTYHSLENHC